MSLRLRFNNQNVLCIDSLFLYTIHLIHLSFIYIIPLIILSWRSLPKPLLLFPSCTLCILPDFFLRCERLKKQQTHTYCCQHYHVIVCHIPLIGPYSPAGPPEVVLWCFLPGFRQIWPVNSAGSLVIPAGVVVHSAVSGVSLPWALDPLQVI